MLITVIFGMMAALGSMLWLIPNVWINGNTRLKS